MQHQVSAKLTHAHLANQALHSSYACVQFATNLKLLSLFDHLSLFSLSLFLPDAACLSDSKLLLLRSVIFLFSISLSSKYKPTNSLRQTRTSSVSMGKNDKDITFRANNNMEHDDYISSSSSSSKEKSRPDKQLVAVKQSGQTFQRRQTFSCSTSPGRLVTVTMTMTMTIKTR